MREHVAQIRHPASSRPFNFAEPHQTVNWPGVMSEAQLCALPYPSN